MAGIRVRPVGVGSGSVGCCAGMAVVRSGRITLLWAFHVTGATSPALYSRGIDDARRRLALHPDRARGGMHGHLRHYSSTAPVEWKAQTRVTTVSGSGRSDLPRSTPYDPRSAHPTYIPFNPGDAVPTYSVVCILCQIA
jgi:hypothetical protein